MQLHAFRIKDGEDLHQAIGAYVKQHNISAGFIVSGVAGLKKLRLRLAGTPGQLPVIERDGLFEVLSIDGTVSVAALHIHVAVSDEAGNAIGGHLLSEGNIVRLSAEIGIIETDALTFDVEMDEATGFKELVVKES